jgi:hypothetical protein
MTAVDYYNQEIKELFNMHQDGEISGNMFHVQRLVALTKAKEMEKQQIMDFGHTIKDELAFGSYSDIWLEEMYEYHIKNTKV